MATQMENFYKSKCEWKPNSPYQALANNGSDSFPNIALRGFIQDKYLYNTYDSSTGKYTYFKLNEHNINDYNINKCISTFFNRGRKTTLVPHQLKSNLYPETWCLLTQTEIDRLDNCVKTNFKINDKYLCNFLYDLRILSNVSGLPSSIDLGLRISPTFNC